ncbi:ESX-1 secretion-associated protein [Nocardia panacis]|uniref:ESX-1 secretion-associated protein n=1 Tax=Nocardia panacis TaxID=2340916 RepID=A0A3A4KIP8_9NOCA|nr:type VII secretion target [Nocardia panacis]RJO76484.1 ESX-1 secretion-associated protein [Nocardia panacis]
MAEQQSVTGVQVDTGVLRIFAKNLGDEANSITDLKAGDEFGAAAGALPGTEFGTAAKQAGEAASNCLTRIGERFTTLAESMHNAAGAYDQSQDDFATKLKTIGLR